MSDEKEKQPTLENPDELDEATKAALAELDSESNTRTLKGPIGLMVSAIALAFTCFQLYTGMFGSLDAYLQRAVHLGFGLGLVYLLFPMRSKWSKKTLHPIDAILAVVAVLSPAYVFIEYQQLVLRAGMINDIDLIFGFVGFVLLLEATRRVVGIPMLTVAILFVIYAFAGPYVPGALAHRGLDLGAFIGHLYYTTEGIFGIPLGVSATFIFLFIVFGSFLEITGLGKFFIDIANAIAGWAAGGPAKVAVLSSGLMGTISGSSVANVAGTGSFTIPMMKKLGYDKNFAGAVEAAASTGGQLMPPIMGAAAFLMAEFVGIPYIEIVKAATVPAILYFAGIWIGVHLEAKKNNLKGVPRDQLPKAMVLFKEKGHLAIPLVVILYLLVAGYTPMKAALWAIFLSIAAAMLRKSTRINFKQIIEALISGAKGALGVVVACATAGVIIGVVTKTGVGLKVASTLMDWSGGVLILAMMFTMITSLLLGMGVPTTANYVITSTIAAPALVLMGVPILAAHMFVFYFGIIADVTPPVALAAFAGAAISKGEPLMTGVNASKLAIGAFLIPYIFVFSPVMLMIDATPLSVIGVTITATIGMIGVSASLVGYLITRSNPLERVLSFVGGILLVDPGLATDAVGFGILAVVYLLQRRRVKNTPALNA
ncbi:MAG: TRAP transporter permease [Sporomusaceae bacterium]|nr:TRAP transporter permease [Sporomusaceae bacterium]